MALLGPTSAAQDLRGWVGHTQHRSRVFLGNSLWKAMDFADRLSEEPYIHTYNNRVDRA